MRRALTIGFVCASIIFSAACTATPYKAGRIQDDPELYFGDQGVENLVYPQRLHSLQDKDAPARQPRDPYGFPLNKQAPNPKISPLKGSYIENVIATAKSYLGTPYVFGANRMDPSAFDCSSFTRWVFLESLGIDLPWNSRSQAAYVKAFSKNTYTSLHQAKRGDLLFFSGYRGEQDADYKGLQPFERTISHMGIYLGNGKIIHTASKMSGGVRIDKMTWRQLHNRFVFGGGILD